VRSHSGPWDRYSSWQRWTFLVILFLVATSNYFDYFVMSVLLEPIKHEYALSDTALGLLSGTAFSIMYGLTALPIARWADRGNRRTVIALALAAWSTMTVVCGLTRSFWQLLVARFGVGAVEPGALPPAQSLVVDYFPPERRATAIAILTQGGSATGWLLGVVVGGYIAARHGWRSALIVAGAPGLILAVLVRLLLPEPRLERATPTHSNSGESIGAVFSHLRRKRSLRFLLLGLSAYGVFAYAIATFLPAFMLRVLHATLDDVSLRWGVIISAANVLGAVVGGRLADALTQRDCRWYGWLPAAGCLLAAPLYWLALEAQRFASFVALDFLAEATLSIGMCVSFVGILTVSGASRRVTAVAIALFTFTLVGGSIGPAVAGVISDALHRSYGTDSLRHSLMIMCFLTLPAGVAFIASGLALPDDIEA
jgi:predicted MFS family arabinose efflux permease